MAPSIAIDTTPDFNPSSTNTTQTRAPRTLLLSPPSLSAHPERLNETASAHDRSTTDIQMLDRLALSLVNLPDATYDLITILTDADHTRTESQKLLTSSLLSNIVRSLKPGGRLQSEDGTYGTADQQAERADAIFAGLIIEGNAMVRPNYENTAAVPLRLNKKKTEGGAAAVTSAAGTGAVSLNLNGKRKNGPSDVVRPSGVAGVGFVDFSDDLDAPIEEEDSDDELIDENTLIDEADLNRPVIQPPECRPNNGKKRRRACKDCTCGLAEKLAAEDAAKRSQAVQTLAKLKADDLAEVDFTVQGKVGSCGNCALGDAFRCDGCPYIGLPPFKPGEEVRLVNDEVQL